MRKTLITMTSITYAMKAKQLLNSERIYCEVERTPKDVGSGCGYSIRIKDNAEDIKDILSKHKIPYKETFTIY